MTKPIVVRFVNASVSWKAFRDPSKGGWVGVCDQLRLASEAETWEELVSISSEIVDGLLTDLLEDGDLERFLAHFLASKRQAPGYSRARSDSRGPPCA